MSFPYTKLESLFNAYPNPKHVFTIQDDIGQRRFHAIQDLREFSKWYLTQEVRHVYEKLHREERKPYIDYDLDIPEKMDYEQRELFREKVWKALRHACETTAEEFFENPRLRDVLYFSSSTKEYQCPEIKEKHRISYHAIFPEVCLPSLLHCKHFAEKVAEKMPEDMQGVDMRVYDKNRDFRIVFSRKLGGEEKKPVNMAIGYGRAWYVDLPFSFQEMTLHQQQDSCALLERSLICATEGLPKHNLGRIFTSYVREIDQDHLLQIVKGMLGDLQYVEGSLQRKYDDVFRCEAVNQEGKHFRVVIFKPSHVNRKPNASLWEVHTPGGRRYQIRPRYLKNEISIGILSEEEKEMSRVVKPFAPMFGEVKPKTPSPPVESEEESSPSIERVELPVRPRRVAKKIATPEPSPVEEPKMKILEEEQISDMVDLEKVLNLYLTGVQKRTELKEELGKLLERAKQIEVEIVTLNKQNKLLSRRSLELEQQETEETDDDDSE